MTEIQQGVNILLTKEDATIFVAFKNNRDKFIEMLKAGVFNLESGKVEININNNQIQNIYIHQMTYKRSAVELRDNKKNIIP